MVQQLNEAYDLKSEDEYRLKDVELREESHTLDTFRNYIDNKDITFEQLNNFPFNLRYIMKHNIKYITDKEKFIIKFIELVFNLGSIATGTDKDARDYMRSKCFSAVALVVEHTDDKDLL